MSMRCFSSTNLRLFPANPTSNDNSINNAQVLCDGCYEKALSAAGTGTKLPEFTEATKQEAIRDSQYRCECVRDACH